MVKRASPNLPVLLVDDESGNLFTSRRWLASSGLAQVETLSDSRELIPFIKANPVGVVVLDLFMPNLSGQKLLPEIVQNHPEVPVIIMTASHDLENAVNCMKAGAFDYLTKPVEPNKFVGVVQKALEIRMLRYEVESLKERLFDDTLHQDKAFAAITTSSRKMKRIFQYLEAVAGSTQPVLITGETGVGKELVAHAIHTLSGLEGEFIAENVAGLDDNVFSDTLLGHKKGAFTGAERDRKGMIAMAAGGTLFLDEIGDLGPVSQVKLLRLLQDNSYYPLGADTPVRMDARVVVATNRNLQAMMREGKFRADLYYRLSAHHVHIPPLRERVEDIPLLVARFLDEAATALGKNTPTIPPELLQMLALYSFPGNVRELRAMLFDAVARHQHGVLSLASFREVIKLKPVSVTTLNQDSSQLLRFDERLFPTLKEAEELIIQEAMRRSNGKQSIAAGLLGITRQALNRRLRVGAAQLAEE